MSDQFLNKSYICAVWKVGPAFGKDENGVISKDETKKKVEQLVGDGHESKGFGTEGNCLE